MEQRLLNSIPGTNGLLQHTQANVSDNVLEGKLARYGPVSTEKVDGGKVPLGPRIELLSTWLYQSFPRSSMSRTPAQGTMQGLKPVTRRHRLHILTLQGLESDLPVQLVRKENQVPITMSRLPTRSFTKKQHHKNMPLCKLIQVQSGLQKHKSQPTKPSQKPARSQPNPQSQPKASQVSFEGARLAETKAAAGHFAKPHI